MPKPNYKGRIFSLKFVNCTPAMQVGSLSKYQLARYKLKGTKKPSKLQ